MRYTFTFGRMNPPTSGHRKLVNKLSDIAQKNKSRDYGVYLSKTQDKRDNPLSFEDKMHYAKVAFGDIMVAFTRARTVIEVMKELEKKKFTDITMVVGSDRVREFDTLLKKYNGKDYTFDSIEVLSAGERDPDARGAAGMSASKMRAAAAKGDFEAFKKGSPFSKFRPADESLKYMFHDVRKGLGLKYDPDMTFQQEQIEELDDSLMDFEVSDNEIDFVLNHVNFEDEEELEEAVMTPQQRKKRSMIMKRLAPRLKIKRLRAMKKAATPDKLLKRAKKAALGILRKKVAGKLGAAYQTLKPAAKVAVDKLVDRHRFKLDKLAKRMLPDLRAKDKARVKAFQQKKQEELFKPKDVNTLFKEQVLDEVYDSKLARLLQQVYKDDTERKFVIRALKQGEKVLGNPALRGYALDLLMKLLKAVQDDPSTYNRIKDKLMRMGQMQVERRATQDPDIKDKEGTQPKKYHSGLAKSTKQKRDAQFKKQAKMDDDNPDAYKPAPGDKDAKTKPSKYTQAYRKMFGEAEHKEYECPPATKDVALNTKNRNATRDNHMYGPLNVKEPGDYWQKLADRWDTDLEAAKKSTCGVCVAFDISPRMTECMPGAVSDESGRLGYCWMHHFKCHSKRSCDTWASGGPITTDKVSYDWHSKAFPKGDFQESKIEEMPLKLLSILPGHGAGVMQSMFPKFANFFARATSPSAFKYFLDKYKELIDKGEHKKSGSAIGSGRVTKASLIMQLISPGFSRKYGITPRPTMQYINHLVNKGKLDRKYRVEEFEINESFKATFLDEKAKEGLKKKAEKSGFSYDKLKKVYDRGVAAWRTGHRPGTTPQQWGYARVNAFITKIKSGKELNHDQDLAPAGAKVKKDKKEDINLAFESFLNEKAPVIGGVKMTKLGKGRPGKMKDLVKKHLGAKAAEKITKSDGAKLAAIGKKKDDTNLVRKGNFIKNMMKEDINEAFLTFMKSPYDDPQFIGTDGLTNRYKEATPGQKKTEDSHKRIPRKPGQPAGSDKHSDLYTDENPKGTIQGLKFATVEDAEKSVRKIENSGKTHAHKVQAAVAMEQRAREMGKISAANVYRKYINKMKEITKQRQKEDIDEVKHSEHEITVDGYTTKHFHMCGSAQEVMKKNADVEGAGELTRLQDDFFKLEKEVMINGAATDSQKSLAQELYNEIMRVAGQASLADDITDYMKLHIDSIMKGDPKPGFGRTDMSEAVNRAQQAAIAIAKKKSGKYDKDGNKLESLWQNIKKKRDRIARGSGERMRKKGEKGAPTADQIKRAQEMKEKHGGQHVSTGREMTDAEKKKREDIKKGLMKNKKDFKDRYGKDADSVMNALATKMAMKEEDECSCFDHVITEAEYEGRKVKLNDPIRTTEDPKHKFKVYVKNDKGNIVVVRFGDPNLSIKRDDPARRKSFRARHNCDDPGPKYKPRYWSCFQWRAGAEVDN